MNTKVAIKIIQQTPMVETKVYEPRQTANFCATMHLVKKHTFTFGHCSRRLRRTLQTVAYVYGKFQQKRETRLRVVEFTIDVVAMYLTLN